MQEVINLIKKLDADQKKIILATLRGAVLIAECEKEAHHGKHNSENPIN